MSNEFAALADIRDTRSMSDGIIRVRNNTDLSLEFASSRTSSSGSTSTHRYHLIGGDIALKDVTDATAESTMRTAAATTQQFGSDTASAWVDSGGTRFRLPKLDPLYDSPFAAGWARGVREAVTERELLNCHGTFYEVPRSNSGGYRKMRALATHGKRITDFASWRGLFVLTGVLDDAPASDKLVKNPDGTAALWLGEIDDLWRMGEPRGTGGPWKDTAVTANTASDPYLMYGYDQKELTLTAADGHHHHRRARLPRRQHLVHLSDLQPQRRPNAHAHLPRRLPRPLDAGEIQRRHHRHRTACLRPRHRPRRSSSTGRATTTCRPATAAAP